VQLIMPDHRSPNRARGGVTLVELLVFMALLGVLLTVMTALVSSAGAGRRANDRINQRATTVETIAQLIGYDTLESDEIGPEGDRLFFDEECFLRGTSGRFQIDRVVPVSGKSVVVGSSADGTELRDVHSSADDIRARLKYL